MRCFTRLTLTESYRADDNFLLWSLIPYIAALSGENLMDKSISFDEAATLRPDGGLSKEEYAFLAENGIVKNNGDYDWMFKSSIQIVWLED